MLSAPEGRADSRPSQAAATVADVMRLAAEAVAEGDHVAAATYLMQHASADLPARHGLPGRQAGRRHHRS